MRDELKKLDKRQMKFRKKVFREIMIFIKGNLINVKSIYSLAFYE